MRSILLIFFICISVFAQGAEDISHEERKKAEAKIIDYGFKLSDVKLIEVTESEGAIYLEMLSPAVILGNSLLAGDEVELTNNRISSISFKDRKKILRYDGYSCYGSIRMAHKKICRCRIAQEIDLDGVLKLDKNTDVWFKDRKPYYFKKESPWVHNNKKYRTGIYKLDQNKQIALLEDDKFAFSLCVDLVANE